MDGQMDRYNKENTKILFMKGIFVPIQNMKLLIINNQINKFSKVPGYKTKIQNIIVFIHEQ